MEIRDLNGITKITVAGEEMEVNKTDSVKAKLKEILTAKSITSFVIFVNGEEVTTSADLPDTFSDNVVEVRRYVKPGSC